MHRDDYENFLKTLEAQIKEVGIETEDGTHLNFYDLLIIDEASLDNEFTRQPAMYAWLATLAANALAEYERCRNVTKQVKATAAFESRVTLGENFAKVTENMIKEAVEADENYQEAVTMEIEAKHFSDIMTAVTDAAKQRMHMLMSLGAWRRQEMDHLDLKMRMRSKKNDD